jgi:hypothetical protein
MKKIIACLALAAFVTAPALQAGDSAACEKSCSAKATSCCAEKSACSKTASKVAKGEVKGASLLLAKK